MHGYFNPCTRDTSFCQTSSPINRWWLFIDKHIVLLSTILYLTPLGGNIVKSDRVDRERTNANIMQHCSIHHRSCLDFLVRKNFFFSYIYFFLLLSSQFSCPRALCVATNTIPVCATAQTGATTRVQPRQVASFEMRLAVWRLLNLAYPLYLNLRVNKNELIRGLLCSVWLGIIAAVVLARPRSRLGVRLKRRK